MGRILDFANVFICIMPPQLLIQLSLETDPMVIFGVATQVPELYRAIEYV
jgi:hypothetical protein